MSRSPRTSRTDGVAYVDDRPLAERALAARAGIGWIGKNTNLLTHARAGSWVFLGALLTSAELEPDEPIRTTCGSCTRCLSGCPTGALVAPQTIDARRCISYLTIERPGTLEPWEAEALDDWIFGCDVCQEVCPVNADADDTGPLLVPLLPLIEWLLPLGGRAFDRAVGESALRRAGRHRLLRNAIAALGNAARARVAGRFPPRGGAGARRARRPRRAPGGPRPGIVHAGAPRLMPRVSPFRGLHYSIDRFAVTELPARIRTPDDEGAPPARVADVTDVVCPPYDVIDEEGRRALLARHDRNAVRLEFSPEPGSARVGGEGAERMDRGRDA